jgi:hypothetical protein
MFEASLYTSLFLHFGCLVPKGIVFQWEHRVSVLSSPDVRHGIEPLLKCDELRVLSSAWSVFSHRPCMLARTAHAPHSRRFRGRHPPLIRPKLGVVYRAIITKETHMNQVDARVPAQASDAASELGRSVDPAEMNIAL